MAETLWSYVMKLPELGGRVGLDTISGAPAYPYAVVWDKPGGRDSDFYGGASVNRVYPCVTLYDRPGSGEAPAAARYRLMQLGNALIAGRAGVDTYSDEVTPFLPGSFMLQADFSPLADKDRAGASYLTLQFTALIYRQ